MSDFPDLGSEFATAPSSAIDGGDIDFDKAVSAFPDISLDGEGDFPTPHIGGIGGGGFSFGDFGSHDVKVTRDDEFEKFDYQFPDVDVDVPGQVCTFECFSNLYTTLTIFLLTARNPSFFTTHIWCSTPLRTPSSTVQLLQYTYPESAYRRRRAPSHQVSLASHTDTKHSNPTHLPETGVPNNNPKSPSVTRNPKTRA